MDVFSSTFHSTALAAGVPVGVIGRHLPVFRRCVDADDPTVLVARCLRPEHTLAGEFMLLLTHRRLVVTQETRIFHRLRLHLNANLRHLSDVTWNPNLRQSAVDVAATAVDGVRERFRMRLGEPDQVWQLDELLTNAFRAARRSSVSLAA